MQVYAECQFLNIDERDDDYRGGGASWLLHNISSRMPAVSAVSAGRTNMGLVEARKHCTPWAFVAASACIYVGGVPGCGDCNMCVDM